MGSVGGERIDEWFAAACSRLFDVLIVEEDPAVILGELARIAGETLRVDRTLIYDVSFRDEQATGLAEWIAPHRPGVTSTRATYPLAFFRNCAELLFSSRTWFESHADAPHEAIVADHAVALFHYAMAMRSLLWYPFSFRADGFYVMVFNYADERHVWEPRELAFMQAATRHAGMALMKIELLRQRAAAEEAMFLAQKRESLGILAGGVAHDLNSLMVGVVSSADLLARKLGAGSPLCDLVNTIAEAGTRASRLAGQLLAYAGKTTPGTAVVSFADIARETIALVRSTIEPEVEFAVEPDAPAVEGNTSQLEQIVMNLLVNAAEAVTTTSVIQARLGARMLDSSAAAELGVEPGRYAVFAVEDRGIGMDAAVLARVFDPFFSTKFSGRGLGLSAVQGIVRHHGGAIRIASSPGVGSTVTVWIPAAEPEPASARACGRTILVIDDEPAVLAGVTALLEDAGFRCRAAGGGREGLAAFEADGPEIGGVLLDLTMPAPCGLEVLRVLRCARPDLPVVLMSGYAREASALPLDARTRFIAKPFATAALVAALDAVLSQPAAIEQVERGR